LWCKNQYYSIILSKKIYYTEIWMPPTLKFCLVLKLLMLWNLSKRMNYQINLMIILRLCFKPIKTMRLKWKKKLEKIATIDNWKPLRIFKRKRRKMEFSNLFLIFLTIDLMTKKRRPLLVALMFLVDSKEIDYREARNKE